MAEYNRSSLLNIATQDYEVLSGSISRQGQSIILGPNSGCRFTLEYLFSKNNLQTSSFCIKSSVNNSDNNIISRYNPKVKINLYIQYYEEDNSVTPATYKAVKYYTRQVLPYFNSEIDGYIDEVCIGVKNELIKKLYIDIVNDSENVVTFSSLSIYKEQTATEIVEKAMEGVNLNKIWKSIDIYEDELVAYDANNNNPVTFRVSEGEADNIYKINVSDVYSLYIALHSGRGPYRGSNE